MCVHVFDGSPSPGCCNYAFLKTAIDNKVRYREEVSKTLLHNFYVDDLLKTVETEELGIWLIRDVQTMCQTGGLTKFISNKKLVIQSVPEYVSRNGIKKRRSQYQSTIRKGAGSLLGNRKGHFQISNNVKRQIMVNNKYEIHCSFLMRKARATPMKVLSILRLGLAAAVLTGKCSKFIKKEISIRMYRWKPLDRQQSATRIYSK